MDTPADRLFHELVDLSPADRDRILSARGIPPDLRAELEALLRSDAAGDHLLTRAVSEAARGALETIETFSDRCGPYRLVRAIGSGGMGAVYLAERADGEIEQRTAIKFLRPGADRPF